MTPQANTTVESEFPRLLPPGVGTITGRLAHPSPDMETRLAAYLDDLPDQLGQFGKAPMDAVAVACTGSSYLRGADFEDAAVAAASARANAPVFTSALALIAAFEALGARRLALISPYDDGLTAASLGYWESHGLEAASVDTGFGASATDHPIYGIPADAVRPVVRRLKGTAADVIVILGTGYPSLETIAWAADLDGPPVVSSNLALAWRTVAAVEGRPPAADDLMGWIEARHWRGRL